MREQQEEDEMDAPVVAINEAETIVVTCPGGVEQSESHASIENC